MPVFRDFLKKMGSGKSLVAEGFVLDLAQACSGDP